MFFYIIFGTFSSVQIFFRFHETLNPSFQTQNTASLSGFTQATASGTKKSAFFSNFLFYPLAR